MKKEIRYKVRYRDIGFSNFSVLNNVVSDMLVPVGEGKEPLFRSFQLADGSMVDIPVKGVEFRFSKERKELIEREMERAKNEKK